MTGLWAQKLVYNLLQSLTSVFLFVSMDMLLIKYTIAWSIDLILGTHLDVPPMQMGLSELAYCQG